MPRAATTSDAFNAIAEPRRRHILELLAHEERSVSEIAAALSPLAELPSLPLPAHAAFGLVEQPLSICIQLSCEFRGFCHGTSDYIAPHAD